jgi:hypothetical protein
MKTIKQLKKQEPVYLNDWSDKQTLAIQFDSPIIESKNILFASYGCECYEGNAFVLFEEDGKLFEVNGGHCSCYGLEGQFEPEETHLEALKYRLEKGTLGTNSYSGNEFAAELIQFLGI